MKILNKHKTVSNEWFEEMVRDMNSTQERFISNMKTKVKEEQVSNSSDSDPLNNVSIDELLNSVDDNTREFISKLTQGMEEILKSHKIT